MAADFPDNPNVNDTFTVGDRSWIWNGTTWDAAVEEVLSADAPITFNSSTRTVGLDQAGVQDGRNYIINGAFDFWQRGDGPFDHGANAYSADRWRNGRQASASGSSFTKSTDVPLNFEYSGKFQRDSGNTATNRISLTHRFEEAGYLLAGKEFTISFYAKAGADFSGSFLKVDLSSTSADWSSAVIDSDGTLNGGLNPDYSNNGDTFPLTTSWQRFSFTATMNSAAKSLLAAFRYDPTGTAGADDSFYITGVQLEAGSVATPFKRHAPSLQGELAACQRYYQVIAEQDTNNKLLGTGNYITSTQMRIDVSFVTSMRTNPSIEMESISGGYTFAGPSGDTFDDATISLPGTNNIQLINTTDVSGTAGNAGSVYTQLSGAKVAFDAEL